MMMNIIDVDAPENGPIIIRPPGLHSEPGYEKGTGTVVSEDGVL